MYFILLKSILRNSFSSGQTVLFSLAVFFPSLCLFSPAASVADEEIPGFVFCAQNSDNPYCERRRQWAEEDRQIKKEQREAKARRLEEEARQREERTRQEVQREAARRQRTDMKERERKCEQAERDMKTDMEEQSRKQKDLEQSFFDLEENITDLEKIASESKETVNTELDALKTKSNEAIQNLKDDMGAELKGIDNEIKRMEENIAQLHEVLAKVEEGRLDAFFTRRKQQNEFYSKCFGQALQQTEQKRIQYYQRKTTGNLRKKNIGTLISGGKTKVKSEFSQKFNQLLNLCLNNQAALLEKENHKNEYNLMLEKLRRKEEQAKQKITQLKAQIQNMRTQGKVEVMNKFKEKMQAEIQNFEASYNKFTTNFTAKSQQIIREIEKVKKEQSYVLMNRSQVTSQDTRTLLVSNNCQGGMESFNLFPKNNPGSAATSLAYPSGALQ